MSQKRVITGSDERGRPISRWEDAEPVAGGYGFMEPAFTGTIERRQATPDEMAAARARETPERVRLSAERAMWTHHDIAALRERTGAVTGEETIRAMTEAGEPPERTEEGAVDEDTGQTQVSAEAPPTLGPLQALANAAAGAQEAWTALTATEAAWDIARAALSDAMAECLAIIDPESLPAAGVTEPDVPERPDRQPLPSSEEVMSEPATLAVVREPRPPLRQPGRHRSSATEATEKQERAQRVTEAVARHGGDRSAAAAELGMRPNAVAMVLKHADRRAGVLA